MLNDSQQRHQATDPYASYIVQAPAGSGKTEILTQRYLRLLSGVNAPEQIIALTFTRKAANEMRERIVRALQDAAINLKATSIHQQQTLSLAREALAKDHAMDWKLLKQPSRLRIITIDSLSQTLTKAIPLQDKQTPYADVSDKPQSHYEAAARACLSFAIEQSDYHEPLKTLLQHVDNRQDNLLALFSELLAKREQWLPLLYQAKAQDKSTFEQALSTILNHELTRLQQSIPNDNANELIDLVRRLVSLNSHLKSPLTHWDNLSQLDSPLAKHLASLLLTSQNTLRKAFDHHVGLKRGDCTNIEYDELKGQSKALLATLSECPDFLDALLRVKNLPAPHYDLHQWTVLQALFSLLPMLAAQLQIIFNEHNEVDFTSISEQALVALGDEECPTDLALYLDNSIHHLLVDEFQDTSIQQFQLLKQLVLGFQPGDGKTLFVVGDPMQSIYRFRSAEVGLFLRAKQEGIGPVRLTPLTLRSNFRSSATVVNWVNEQFKTIFPDSDDMESGAISYQPSDTVKPADNDSIVMAYQFKDRATEALELVKLVATELEKYPQDNIAILVRSRNQLTDIMQSLRAQKIPFQGVEIDPLAKLPHLRDVWTLTKALLMPANRLAWLSLLRSPWCGLSLSDLLIVSQFSKHKSIYFALSSLSLMTTLSDEGRLRLTFIFAVLDEALARRHQQPLISWLTDTLKQLHLDLILDTTEQNDLEQYWLLLERFLSDGQLEELSQFSREFNKLYSQQVVPARLKIMTIHKSKGLEFDCVMLPGLGARPASMNMPLLRWLKLPSLQSEDLLLLSPIKAAHDEHCLLYDYLGKLDAEKSSYELQRLLYVAVTRAKKRLYLFDNSEKISQGSCRHLLKKQAFTANEERDTSSEDKLALPSLFHLPIEYYQKQPLLIQKQGDNPVPGFVNNAPRLIGIVAHELLQWICNHHIEAIADIPWGIAHHQLRTLGFEAHDLDEAQKQLKKQLTQLFNDPIGQWLLKAHEDEHNEYELLMNKNNSLETKIIDRTFCEKDRRWIIDFKTGHDDNHQEKAHHQQLTEYARLFTYLSPKPISCGLYYLANNHWIAWEYQP